MKQIWEDPTHPAGFSSVSKLSKASGKTRKQTEDWLKGQMSYTLHKPIRKRFPMRPYKTSGINDLWQADLMEMIPYAKINKGYKYILTCIDVFSRFSRAVPLKSKSAIDVTSAINVLIKSTKPRHFQTDQGKEFYNSSVKKLLNKHKINHYSVYSQNKAALVERFNRTLRERINKIFTCQGNKIWIDVLPKVINAYNNSVHRSINMKPIDVTDDVAMDLWMKQNSGVDISKKNRYKIGDVVRISKNAASPFNKNFDQNWSDEVFKIIAITRKTKPVMYTLEDFEQETLLGKFYEPEIQVVDVPDVYRIQEILRSRGKGVDKQYYVKWHGYSKPTWIKKSNLV
jgi:L-rhamnose mutarotase